MLLIKIKIYLNLSENLVTRIARHQEINTRGVVHVKFIVVEEKPNRLRLADRLVHAFSSNLSPLSLPPSSWKMHEATTINSFRHFLDNRETFNRGEGARRRKGVGIEALCAHRIPLWSLAALYHRRHLEKRFPFERANTFSVEGGEVAFLERTQRFPWKSLSIVARSPRFLPSRRASKECGLIERWTTSMNFIPKEERGWRLRRSILNLSRNEVGANYPTCLSRISAHSNFFWTKLPIANDCM